MCRVYSKIQIQVAILHQLTVDTCMCGVAYLLGLVFVYQGLL